MIATGEDPEAVGGKTVVQGKIYGPLGIHLSLEPFLVDGQRLFPEPERWVVTHLGTGRALGLFWDKEKARIFTEALVDELKPGIWDFARPEDAPEGLKLSLFNIRVALTGQINQRPI